MKNTKKLILSNAIALVRDYFNQEGLIETSVRVVPDGFVMRGSYVRKSNRLTSFYDSHARVVTTCKRDPSKRRKGAFTTVTRAYVSVREYGLPSMSMAPRVVTLGDGHTLENLIERCVDEYRAVWEG